jgi:hypothetical protein
MCFLEIVVAPPTSRLLPHPTSDLADRVREDQSRCRLCEHHDPVQQVTVCESSILVPAKPDAILCIEKILRHAKQNSGQFLPRDHLAAGSKIQRSGVRIVAAQRASWASLKRSERSLSEEMPLGHITLDHCIGKTN